MVIVLLLYLTSAQLQLADIQSLTILQDIMMNLRIHFLLMMVNCPGPESPKQPQIMMLYPLTYPLPIVS